MIIIIIRLELVGGYFVFVENKTTEFKREYVDDEMKEMGKPFEPMSRRKFVLLIW